MDPVNNLFEGIDILDLIQDGTFGYPVKEEAAAQAQAATQPQALQQTDDKMGDEDEEQVTDPGEQSNAAQDSEKKQSRPATKACREKARREKLNECYVELAQLVDSSRSPKTDKMSILCDAIKMVKALKVENNQLKQLNKFLEEKVSSSSREQGQNLYQSYMDMLQAATVNIKQQQVAQGSVDTAPSGSAAQGHAGSQAQVPQQIPQQMTAQQLIALQQMMQTVPMAAQQLAAAAAQAGPSQVPGQPMQQFQMPQGMMQQPGQLLAQPFVPTQPWVVDPQQDMKLRPPAA